MVNYSNYLVFDGCFSFVKDIETCTIKLEGAVPQKGRKPWTLLNTSFDACKIIEGNGGKSKNLINMLTKAVVKKPKFPTSCPVKKVGTERETPLSQSSFKIIYLLKFLTSG